MSAQDIPRCGTALFKRLWLAGYGRFDVSKSGALLDRSLIDSSVWQPERLDFAGGAWCGNGVEQRRPAPLVLNADATFIDSARLKDLARDEAAKLEVIRTAARSDKQPQVKKRQDEWIEERVAESLQKIPQEKRPAKEHDLRDLYEKAVTKKRLLGDFILRSHMYGEVSVGEILDNPNKYHTCRFADPLEPEYGNDSRIAFANLKSAGKPYIFRMRMGARDLFFTGPSKRYRYGWGAA